MKLQDFYDEFYEQVKIAEDDTVSGWEHQDFFTSVMLDYLEEAGEIDSPVICPYRDRGIQLNAYIISEGRDAVEIFVSIFHESETLISTYRNDVDAALKRGLQLYRRSTNNLYKSFERDNDTYEFASTVALNKEKIERLKVVALTNGNVKEMQLNPLELDGVSVSFEIWDMDRLYRCVSSGKMRETIEICFEKDYGYVIPCIKTSASEKYSSYLAVINGEVLAKLYSQFGSRLLEKNVRSFLQVRGAVNKGIRETLRSEPEMFLAYNNGISVTAEDVTISEDYNGYCTITKIRDMQIVNGGQTTASIYNAYMDKKQEVNLSNVYVQMKISVINTKTNEEMDEIVKKISAYANTQNKIQMADFSANDPFHRRIEELSRTIWAPAQKGLKSRNWFYERARGQYSNMLARESTSKRRREFKEIHPLFTKTDLAKFENTWDQLPYFVSEGAQKNFKRFTLRIAERKKFMPDEVYYQRLISKAILYKRTEKLVSAQKYGGYRANIVTYTLAFLSHKTAQKIDLNKIWREQILSEPLEKEIVKISRIVHEHIINAPGGANVSEWCKKKKCWDELKDNNYHISEELSAELSDANSQVKVVSSKSGSDLNVATTEEKELIDKIALIEPEVWFSIAKWAKETNNLQGWQRSIAFSLGSLGKRGKTPSYKQAVQGDIIYKVAQEKGFIKK